MGEVHDGTATMDFMPEEQERGITIGSACTTCAWHGSTVNIIDTPGHVDFTIEVERSLRVLDGAVGVFWRRGRGWSPSPRPCGGQSERYKVPKLTFVNKMDRLGADFGAVLEAMKSKLGAVPLPLVVPLGEGQDFEAVIDLVRMQKVVFDQQTSGVEYEAVELSEAEEAYAAPWRERMFETLAEADEEFLEAYLGAEEVGEDAIRAAVRRATLALALVPVFSGFGAQEHRCAAGHGRGVRTTCPAPPRCTARWPRTRPRANMWSWSTPTRASWRRWPSRSASKAGARWCSCASIRACSRRARWSTT